MTPVTDNRGQGGDTRPAARHRPKEAMPTMSMTNRRAARRHPNRAPATDEDQVRKVRDRRGLAPRREVRGASTVGRRVRPSAAEAGAHR